MIFKSTDPLFCNLLFIISPFVIFFLYYLYHFNVPLIQEMYLFLLLLTTLNYYVLDFAVKTGIIWVFLYLPWCDQWCVNSRKQVCPSTRQTLAAETFPRHAWWFQCLQRRRDMKSSYNIVGQLLGGASWWTSESTSGVASSSRYLQNIKYTYTSTPLVWEKCLSWRARHYVVSHLQRHQFYNNHYNRFTNTRKLKTRWYGKEKYTSKDNTKIGIKKGNSC